MRVFLAGASGVIGRRLIPLPATVSVMTTQRGASNAKARRELGFSPQYASWRDGFTAPAT